MAPIWLRELLQPSWPLKRQIWQEYRCPRNRWSQPPSRICDYIKPSLFVFTNIFPWPDGPLWWDLHDLPDDSGCCCKSAWSDCIDEWRQSLFNSVSLKNPVRYYGFDTEKARPSWLTTIQRGILCPRCEHILKYELNTYANLGAYICEDCGFKRPKLDYSLTALNALEHNRSAFTIDGQDYQINIGGLYNIYNALAAVSVAQFFGVDPSTIKSGFDKSRAVFGRQETFKIGDKECTLVLIKNPVGATKP